MHNHQYKNGKRGRKIGKITRRSCEAYATLKCNIGREIEVKCSIAINNLAANVFKTTWLVKFLAVYFLCFTRLDGRYWASCITEVSVLNCVLPLLCMFGKLLNFKCLKSYGYLLTSI